MSTFIKKTNFLFFAFVALPLLSIFGCESIHSQYGSNLIADKNICVYLNIENNLNRVFIRRLKENPNIVNSTDVGSNCDYLLLVVLYQTYREVLNAAGIRGENKITMSAIYDLYKYDKTKTSKIKTVLETPILYSFEQYVGAKNKSMSKSGGANANEHKEKNFDVKGTLNVYYGTKVRIDEILKPISGSKDTEDGIYMVNNALLTSLQQSKEDVENQLAKTLAERVFDDAILDIISYEQSEHKKECREYYDKYLNINFDDKNLQYSVGSQKNTMKEKELFEKSCDVEIKKYRHEKNKIERKRVEEHRKRVKKEKIIRLKMIESDRQSDIEEYRLLEKKREYKKGNKQGGFNEKNKSTASNNRNDRKKNSINKKNS